MYLLKHPKNKKGLTLVEIVVAIAILGFIAAAFLTMFSSAFSGIFSLGRRTQAMNDDAQSIMELIYENYPEDENFVDKLLDPALLDPDEDLLVTDKDFTIDVIEDEGPSDMHLVRITVVYESGRTVSLSGLVPAP